MNIQGFLGQFLRLHENMPDRPFCWVLGSGASFQSGIPTGAKLAMDWIKELHEMFGDSKLSLEQWATADNLKIKNFKFKDASSFYPWIYQRRFEDNRDEGYAFLEKVMDQAEPSCGYSVLAQIMADTRHKVAITTNFDNLIADSLSIYTDAFPLVCGHESLTGYIRANLRRPLIAKIHRDLLLNPLSEPEQIEKLPDCWEDALKIIFRSHTPIVIGYGGNDGSLMDFLERLEPIQGGIYWCHLLENEPGSLIQKVVEQHHGRLVPILGFDELMLQLSEKLQLASPISELQTTHDKRKTELLKQFVELNKKINQPGKNEAAEAMLKEIRTAANFARERLGLENTSLGWQLRAIAEPDMTKHEAIYREGLEKFPNSVELISQLAFHLDTYCKSYDEAELLYRKAVELNPSNAFYVGELAYFLETVRKNNSEADLLWRKAGQLDPNPTKSYHFLGSFNAILQKDFKSASEFLNNASKNVPADALTFFKIAKQFEGNWKIPKIAGLFYQKAIALNPNDERIKMEFVRFQKEYPEFTKQL